VGWAEEFAAWEPYLERLREAGFQIELTSVAFPVQLEGNLPTGEAVYFRERSGLASLVVGSDEDPVWSTDVDLWNRPGAEVPSFLTAQEAYVVFLEILASRP
jgi:hypothetical protein